MLVTSILSFITTYILTLLYPNSKLWTVLEKVHPFSKIILHNYTRIQDSKKYTENLDIVII